MSIDSDLSAELHILGLFNLDTAQAGIKIHKSADVVLVDAAQRLFDKGLTTQVDGGYLTAIGRDAAEHLQVVLGVLTAGSAAQTKFALH